MKRNVGNIDRGFRGLIGVSLVLIFFVNPPTTPLLYWGCIILGLVMLATSVFRWCPPYSLFGINTGKADTDE